ncbi:uncharacterized protein [Panulirus ornatus]|uniref:uncharacterized protein isoform X2 n=1 Tax=Panulirus ornatus TaxID=150431 RepID=UPI003A8AB5F8
MPQRFIPMYDVKIRGGERIIEWRFGAHPTVHTVSPSGVPLVVRQKARATSTFDNITSSSDHYSHPGPPPAGGGGRGENFSVLPPIKDTSRRRDEDFSLSELDDISLKNEILRVVKGLPERGIQALLINLRAQDRDRDGILSTDIVKGTIRKFQVHLSEEGQKNLCKKFGQAGDLVSMVRYEEMVSYLTKSRMEALRAPPPMPNQRPEDAPGDVAQPQQQQQQQHPRKVTLRNRVLFSDRDEGKLFVDLERQLADKPVNMADLRRTMYDLDRDRNDFLSGQQVEVAFSKCGIYLTPDVRARLLLATDRTGAGIYKIETLMNYLTRVIPETHNTVSLGHNHQPRLARTGLLPMFQNQSMLNAPWDMTPPQQQQRLETRTDFLPDEGFSEDAGSAGDHSAREQSHTGHQRRYAATAPPPAPPAAGDDVETQPDFDVQKWSSDYQYLAQAVYNADQDQSGYMPADEIQHVTSTYNLVYNLQISEPTLTSALNMATDPNFEEVNLEYFIAILQDLHFREHKVH